MKRLLLMMLVAAAAYGFDVAKYRTETTAMFRIRYEKGVSTAEAKKIGKLLDASYAEYRKILGVTLQNKVDVLIYTSVGRFRTESESRAFTDGDYRLGKLFLAVPSRPQKMEGLQNVVNRIVAKALLEQVRGCPPWFAEAYSLYAGHDLRKFGQPARLNIKSLDDLGEDYASAESGEDVKELYAKLASTIQFFVDRYGKEKVEEALVKFKSKDRMDEVFRDVFKEQVSDIEKEWVKALRAPIKG